LQMRFSRQSLRTGVEQPLAEPSDADAQCREGQGARHLGDKQWRTPLCEVGIFTARIEMQNKAQPSREQARPQSTKNAGDEDRRNEEEIERLISERWSQRKSEEEGDGNESDGTEVSQDFLLRQEPSQETEPCRSVGEAGHAINH